MTARRAARAERQIGDGLHVPVELLDIQHPCWRSAPLTSKWFDRHHLIERHVIADESWPRRYQGAANVWADANGLMDPRWPLTVDRARLQALGIQTSGIARLLGKASNPNETREQI